MLSKKLTRAWGAIRIRYPIFQTISVHKKLLLSIGVIFAAGIFYSFLWTLSIPQRKLELTPLTGVPDNLISTFIEIAILLTLGVSLLVWKTIATTDNIRINVEHSEVPDSMIFPVNPASSVEIHFDSNKHYNPPPILEACLRWVEFDREEFFLVEAGSLDIPKLSLNAIVIDEKSSKIEIELGSSSFFDIFYTHYSPDLVLSSQSSNEEDNPTTLRTLFGESIFQHYAKHGKKNLNTSITINRSSLLPSPLGISGIILMIVGNKTYVALRKRGSHEIAAKNQLEWSFAGLIEATYWFHESKVDFERFAKLELDDEVISKAPALKKYDPKIEPLGLVFNPLYLYQPEIFITAKFTISEDKFFEIKRNLDGLFLLVSSDRLHDTFKNHKIKNLCLPGLKLLTIAYPSLLAQNPSPHPYTDAL